MKIYVTIRVNYYDLDSKTSKFTLTEKWGDKTCLAGHFRDDFDWQQSSTNKKCYFGRNINDDAITAFVVVCA